MQLSFLNNFNSPIELDCEKIGKIPILKTVIENGADVEKQNNQGNTPLKLIEMRYGTSSEFYVMMMTFVAKRAQKAEQGPGSMAMSLRMV